VLHDLTQVVFCLDVKDLSLVAARPQGRREAEDEPSEFRVWSHLVAGQSRMVPPGVQDDLLMPPARCRSGEHAAVYDHLFRAPVEYRLDSNATPVCVAGHCESLEGG
jgi:hypothetical protein